MGAAHKRVGEKTNIYVRDDNTIYVSVTSEDVSVTIVEDTAKCSIELFYEKAEFGGGVSFFLKAPENTRLHIPNDVADWLVDHGILDRRPEYYSSK